MATSAQRERESLREGLLFMVSLVLGLALTCLAFTRLFSCVRSYHAETAADQELERVGHLDQTDPATLTPHQGFPYVIADDELCRIEITDEVYLLDEEDYHGYGQTLSKNGYEFELTIENKSQHLTIGAGVNEEPWTAEGDYHTGEHHKGIPVTYNGFINKIGPGESRDGTFALGSDHGNLYAVSAVYGSFVIWDEHNKVIATYPFSYVEQEPVHP